MTKIKGYGDESIWRASWKCYNGFMTLHAVLQALGRSYFFEVLSPEEVIQVASFCQVKHFELNEHIFMQGSEATAFYVVMSGQIKAYKLSAEGKEMILHLFGPDEMFAEFPIFCDLATYPVNALCLKPSKVVAIDGRQFKAFAVNHPELLLRLLSRLAQRLRAFSDLIEDLSLRSVESRLAKYLLTLSEQANKPTMLRVNKKTLAAILGTVPETLSRGFRRLSQDGVITLKGQTIEVLDRQALKLIAGEEIESCHAYT